MAIILQFKISTEMYREWTCNMERKISTIQSDKPNKPLLKILPTILTYI